MLTKYFSDLSPEQLRQFAMLDELYHDWNSKINVISRKDIDNLYEHHVLHSLGIAKFFWFELGTTIMDLGTGGGFPGIPLAILFPECRFHLVDSIGKKIKVASAVADAIGLTNVRLSHARGEEIRESYDFVVTRAVMPIPDLVKCVRKNTHNILALKGPEEVQGSGFRVQVYNLNECFDEEFFETKKVIHIKC